MCICFTPIVVVQSLSHAQPTPWTATLIPYNHLILCRPLLLLPSVFPSIRVFSNESCPSLCDSVTAACQALLSFTIFWSLLTFMFIELVMLANKFILCHPLLLLPSVSPSIWVFSNELALHIRWPKHWSFSCSNSPSNEYSGLISFRTDWFDLSQKSSPAP